jgi:tetratricopeptide (TPR) repeat protein
VYSLGATLYCLLTGNPPYEGDDIGEILRKVRIGDFVGPRGVNPSLDRALEAVCLKAMATKPEDRHPSCRTLAEDLERWMADESVSAWAEPWTRKLLRWLTRHRTGVTGAAAAVLAGVVGLSAVLAVQTRANAQLSGALKRETKARLDLAAANGELIRSKHAVQARYDLAVDAIKTFHTGVSEDFLLKQEQFKELRNRLLKSASDFYGKLGALLGEETDVASRRALAQSNFELAELTDKVGDKEAALAAHRAVLAAREALAAEPGSRSGILVDVGKSLTATAEILDLMGKTDEAVAACRRAESQLASLAASDPAVRAALAKCRSRLGSFLSRTGRNADALAAYGMARADQEVLAAGPGASNKARSDLADTVQRIALLFTTESGKLSEAEAEVHTAVAIQQKLVDGNPAVTEFRNDLVRSHNILGGVFSRLGKLSEAEAEYRTVVAILQKLAVDNPAVTEFRRLLAIGHNNLGEMLRRTGKLSEAEAEFRAALAIRQKLIHDNPAAIQYRHGLGLSHDSLGLVLRDQAKPAEAEAEFRTAVALLQELAHDNPAVAEICNYLGIFHSDLGDVLQATGRPSEAEAEYRTALAIQQEIADENPTHIDFRLSLASTQNKVGLQLARAKRFPEAFTAIETGLAILRNQVKADPKNTAYMEDIGWSYAYRGRARVIAGQPALAAADLRRARELWARAPHLGFSTQVERSRALALLAGLGRDAKSDVTKAEAAAFADQAVAALRDAFSAGYGLLIVQLKEPDFDALRGRDDFKKLLAEVEAGPKTKPKD